jgi:LmbE family N-acetylglucosaminyl deacetylase
VLAIAAHPDDVELLCAGTLARLNEAGHDLWLAHMTVGDKGGQRPPEELARIRGAEAIDAAGVIGADTFGGICGDLELYASDTHQARLAEILDEARPDVVFTHVLNDYHPDHRITGRLVAGELEGRSGDQPALLYMDSIGAVDFVPELYSDISETVDVKKQMLRCHVSQIEWMSSYRATDMEYIIEWVGRWRGLECGAHYAEGFRLDSRFGRPEAIREVLDQVVLTGAGVAA